MSQHLVFIYNYLFASLLLDDPVKMALRAKESHEYFFFSIFQKKGLRNDDNLSDKLAFCLYFQSAPHLLFLQLLLGSYSYIAKISATFYHNQATSLPNLEQPENCFRRHGLLLCGRLCF